MQAHQERLTFVKKFRPSEKEIEKIDRDQAFYKFSFEKKPGALLHVEFRKHFPSELHNQYLIVTGVNAATVIDEIPNADNENSLTNDMKSIYEDPTRPMVSDNFSEHFSVLHFRAIDRPVCGCFRGDGKTLLIGEKSGRISQFRSGSKKMDSKEPSYILPLYQYSMEQGGHSAVSVIKFLEPENSSITSSIDAEFPVQTKFFACGDDKIVRFWDTAVQKKYLTVKKVSNDSIRCAATFPMNRNLIALGSYDHSCRLIDTRVTEKGKIVSTFDHQDPIEQTLAVGKASDLFYTCGGSNIKVWDMKNTTKPLETIFAHQNTVMDMFFNEDSTQLYSLSLDRTVRVTNCSDYSIAQTLHFDEETLGPMKGCKGFLKGAISTSGKQMVLASSDGKVFNSFRNDAKANQTQLRKFIMNTESYKINVNTYLIENMQKYQELVSNPSTRLHRIMPFQQYLVKFEYGAALNEALKKHGEKDPVIVISLVQELVSRGALIRAINLKNDKELIILLKFIIKYIHDIRFTEKILMLADIVIKIYGKVIGMSPKVDRCFNILRKKIQKEIRLQKELMKTKGIIDLLIIQSVANK